MFGFRRDGRAPAEAPRPAEFSVTTAVIVAEAGLIPSDPSLQQPWKLRGWRPVTVMFSAESLEGDELQALLEKIRTARGESHPDDPLRIATAPPVDKYGRSTLRQVFINTGDEDAAYINRARQAAMALHQGSRTGLDNDEHGRLLAFMNGDIDTLEFPKPPDPTRSPQRITRYIGALGVGAEGTVDPGGVSAGRLVLSWLSGLVRKRR